MESSGEEAYIGADLSALYKQSNGLVQWSPNCRYIAIIRDNRLSIRSSDTLQIIQVYSCIDLVQEVQWAPDSEYILVSMFKRCVVQVFSISNPSWSCKINEGVAGLVHALWSPDSRHVLTVADFKLHMTVWSLTNRATYVIRNPKLRGEGITFSPDGSFVAVAERVDCRDYMGIYSCASWKLKCHFAIATYDVAEISWSPSRSCICARDSFLEFNVFFYSPEGNLLGKYQAYTEALGIKCMAWSPSGQFIATGCYDQKIHMLNNLTWKPIAELNVETSIENVIGYHQCGIDNTKSELDTSFITHNHIPEMPVSTPDPMTKVPRHGVGIVSWSPESTFLASRNDSMPNTLWIWKTEAMKLHSVIVLLNPLKSMRWASNSKRIAFCCGDNRVYLWSTRGTSWINVPSENFRVIGLRWNSEDALALLGKDDVCCVYL